MAYIEIGKVLNTHGILGQLKIKSYSNLDRFKKNSIIYFLLEDEYIQEKVKINQQVKGLEIVKLYHYNDINEVLKYKGCSIFISEDQQIPLEEGFYYHELIGKKIFNQKGEEKGEVTEVLDYAYCDMLIIKIAENKTKMIPFIDAFIAEVLEDRIIIEEIEGLL